MEVNLVNRYLKLSEFSFMKRNDDDFFDKMIRKFSSIMMLVFSVVITLYQFVGQVYDLCLHCAVKDM
jgi:hypothetical protein